MSIIILLSRSHIRNSKTVQNQFHEALKYYTNATYEFKMFYEHTLTKMRAKHMLVKPIFEKKKKTNKL